MYLSFIFFFSFFLCLSLNSFIGQKIALRTSLTLLRLRSFYKGKPGKIVPRCNLKSLSGKGEMKYFERIIPNRSTETLGLLTSHKAWNNKVIWIDYYLLFYNSDVLKELNSLGIQKNYFYISYREFLEYKGGPSPSRFSILKLFDFLMLFSLEFFFSEFFIRFLLSKW